MTTQPIYNDEIKLSPIITSPFRLLELSDSDNVLELDNLAVKLVTPRKVSYQLVHVQIEENQLLFVVIHYLGCELNKEVPIFNLFG